LWCNTSAIRSNRLNDAAVYLVPIGSGRFELYTEPPDDSAPAPPSHGDAGFVQRTIQRLHQRWRDAVDAATEVPDAAAQAGAVRRARDWTVRRLAESIAEQRTLWSLRGVTTAVMHVPSNVSERSAAAARDTLLSRARRHHGIRLMINLVGLALTAALIVLPGPNLIGYYFLFRVAGHFLSWRGARQGRESIVWRLSPDAALTELGALADLPREERAERVAALAAALGLPHLAVFFDRAACPAR
jgi:K+-H+ exchange-related protein